MDFTENFGQSLAIGIATKTPQLRWESYGRGVAVKSPARGVGLALERDRPKKNDLHKQFVEVAQTLKK